MQDPKRIDRDASQLAKSMQNPALPFQKLLASLDPKAQAQLLKAIYAYGLDTSDPYFIVLLSHATIAQAIIDSPEVMRKIGEEQRNLHMAIVDSHLDKLKESAAKTLESSIAQSVARLLQHSRSQEELASWQRVALPTCIVILSLMASSMAAGSFLTKQFQPLPSPIALGAAVKLTEQQVQDLKLAATPEGRFALNIATYNPGKVQDCLSSQSEVLKAAIEVPTLGKVEYGACLLWVVPTEQRKFVP